MLCCQTICYRLLHNQELYPYQNLERHTNLVFFSYLYVLKKKINFFSLHFLFKKNIYIFYTLNIYHSIPGLVY